MDSNVVLKLCIAMMGEGNYEEESMHKNTIVKFINSTDMF